MITLCVIILENLYQYMIEFAPSHPPTNFCKMRCYPNFTEEESEMLRNQTADKWQKQIQNSVPSAF